MNITAAIVTSIISCVVSFFLGGVLTAFVAKWKKIASQNKALQEGLKSLLRDRLIEYHNKYIDLGYCPIYAKEVARGCYEAYHALGGNGIATKLYEDIVDLPEEEKKKKVTKSPSSQK